LTESVAYKDAAAYLSDC